MKKLILFVLVCFALAQQNNQMLKNLELYSSIIEQLKPAEINSLVIAIVTPMLPIRLDDQVIMDRLEQVNGILNAHLKLVNINLAKLKTHFENGAKNKFCVDNRFKKMLSKDMAFVGHFSGENGESFTLKVDKKFCGR